MRENQYKRLPPIERRQDGSLYRMTPAQRKQANALIRRECCCYEDGNCIRYKKETEVVTFQGKEITLENLSPVFTPDQEAAKRRELEQQLYEVFRKYADKRQKEEAGA